MISGMGRSDRVAMFNLINTRPHTHTHIEITGFCEVLQQSVDNLLPLSNFMRGVCVSRKEHHANLLRLRYMYVVFVCLFVSIMRVSNTGTVLYCNILLLGWKAWDFLF